MGFNLRTKLESCKSLKFTNASTTATYAAGEMVAVGDTVGVVAENVGTSSQPKKGATGYSATYPNGPDAVLVYEAEKILMDLVSGTGVAVGGNLYFDAAAASKKITPVSTANTLCAKALETVGTTATQVLCDLVVVG